MSDFVVTKHKNQITEIENPIIKEDTSMGFSRHPYISLGLVCLIINGILNLKSAAIALSAVAIVALFFISGLKMIDKIISISFVAVLSVGLIIFNNQKQSLAIFSLCCILALFFIGVYIYATGKMTTDKLVLLMIFAGFILRLVYILYTDVGVMGYSDQQRQHDVFSFGTGALKHFRHAEYIEWFANNFSLPSFKPTGLSQFYHPPFHHFIAGMWIRLNTFLGVSYNNACEGIQFLTLFYSSSVMITMYKIFKVVKLKKLGLGIPMAIICFHPTFIIMSGSVNNDILSVALAFGAVYATILWYKNPCLKTIIPVALCVGGSMMSKMSGGLIAPAVAIVFLYKFITEIKKRSNKTQDYIIQFIIFGLICVPLGLFWQIRNYLLFNLPVTFVPALSENSGQYLGNYSVFQRLFSIDTESLNRIFVAWKGNSYGSSFNEYNCLLALIKTSLFGEFSLFYDNDGIIPEEILLIGNIASKVLFWSTVALILIFIISLVVSIIKKQWIIDGVITSMMIIIFVVVLGSYVKFCFGYPQTCTQNFRYAVPLLIPFTLFIGKFTQYISSDNFKPYCSTAIRTVLTCTTIIFCFSSTIVYIMLGFVS